MTQVYPDHVETGYEHTHTHRYDVSLERIKKHYPNPKVIVDTGGESPFTQRIKAQWPNSRLVQIVEDVRRPESWGELKDGEADLVFCMEVIEHLADDGTYYGRGVGQCLDECKRVLRRGGILFLTTPNLNSICVLLRLLNHDDVSNWAYHPHELSFKTVVNTVSNAGFLVLESVTEEPYMHVKASNYPSEHRRMLDIITQNGFDQNNRGEMTMLIAKKR